MESEEVIECDLCVVGAGAAGIIVVLEYAKSNPGKKIVLVEYGEAKAGENELDRTIEIKNTLNHHLPFECTNKGLGGSTATWGGRCVMYDEIDFIDRPVLNGGCTWGPELFHEVSRYIEPAARYFECGKPQFTTHETEKYKNTSIAEGFQEGEVTDSVIERWSMPTRFGVRYKNELDSLINLSVFQGYELVQLLLNTSGKRVNEIEIAKVGDNTSTKKVKAKQFVLSAGAQETTRILLKNTQLFQSLGSAPDALGKYYQGHLSGKIASVKFYGDPQKTDYGFMKDNDGVYLRRRFQFSKDFLADNDLLNTAIWLDNPLYYDPKHKSGAMSFMYLAMITPFLGKKLAPPAIAHSVTKGKIYKVKDHFINVLRGFPNSLIAPASIFYRRYLLSRKLPGIFLFNPQNVYALHFHSEQVPDASNTMELGEDGKSLLINYYLTDADIHSVIKLHEVLDDWLRKTNCGELQYWFPKTELFEAIRSMSKDGIHQSGTTRIADSPHNGVVDSNLKVWGTENVFVCSSSVFPTSGQANPTFFLGAFAVRLAEYLSKEI